MRWIGLWLKIKVGHTPVRSARKRESGDVVVGEFLMGEGLGDANTIGIYRWEGDL